MYTIPLNISLASANISGYMYEEGWPEYMAVVEALGGGSEMV
jgi:hypothetical protein